eukprot:symbB.v1.2.022250.t3/scaffold1931.1/size95788/1
MAAMLLDSNPSHLTSSTDVPGARNAIGRIDIGTESIQDRSKSMKSYIMDIFERYANESNIEGVDQYNACYGGQACGLCTLSWVESDRWDGRYGIAVATDISEAHPGFMAFVGAATTAALFFPDAPMSHHSQRASCVLHRFDFCKPVGWHDMAPITDGKYSVECYLDALDACHSTLRQKLNGRGPLEVTDLNVFHTGGGYHIVRKAFERLVRAENKGIKPDEKERLLQEKLMPSVALLKIIGPCHTVSSFLNTGSVIMNKMEQALGKIILVFTYGSGCAASMYQMRVDDVPFFDPFEIWKLQFYRNAIKVTPEESVPLHHYYVQTWMKFDYFPQGRRTCKISLWKYEEDAYYLMQIDKFGRRFYHRGGLSSGPMDPSLKLPVDKAEERPTRESWGPVLVRPEEKTVKAISNKPSKEDRFKEIEYRPRCESCKLVSRTFSGLPPNDASTWEELGKPEELQVVILPIGNGSEEKLLEAAEKGDVTTVKHLLQEPADPNCRDPQTHKSPIVKASARGHLKVVKLLLKAHANVELRDGSMNTPLMSAASHGHVEVAKCLMSAGAQKDETDEHGRTALILASTEGHLEVVRLLCEEGCNKDAVDRHGRNSLHCAVTHARGEVAKYLLEQQVDKDQLDRQGRSSLHEAVLSPRTFGLVRHLLDAGVDKHKADTEGLSHYFRFGNLGVVRTLLDAGAHTEMADSDGWTPLHVASWYGHLHLVRVLCQVCLRDTMDQQGRTPLFVACCNGHAEVVRCLIQSLVNRAGCDRNRRDAMGRCPLFEAARLRCGAVVEIMCQVVQDF